MAVDHTKYIEDLTTEDTVDLAKEALSSLTDADAIGAITDWAKEEGFDTLSLLQAAVDEAVTAEEEADDAATEGADEEETSSTP
jgi:hypothetical protein